MVWYRAVKRMEISCDGEWYETFDLTAYYIGLRGAHKVLTVRDVSTDKALVRRLARDCAKGQLDPIHVEDVVVDNIP